MSANNTQGYILLELVLACAAFLLVVGPLMQLGLALRQQQVAANLHHQAVVLAVSEMEELLAGATAVRQEEEHLDMLGKVPCQVIIRWQLMELWDRVQVRVVYPRGEDDDAEVVLSRSVVKE